MMKVIKTATKFSSVSSIEIPEVFFRRFKTGVADLDIAFGGEGFLPGQTFTLAGEPGSGKTTLLLQTLELLQNAGKKTAYISGEESIYQVAFASRRLGLKNLSIANMTVIEDIFDEVEANDFDVIVLDSLPSLQTRTGLEGKKKEEYLASYITEKAKQLEVVVGVILHITKQGKYKGSTLVPHTVDANVMLRVSSEDESIREIEVTKNRFGRTGVTAFPMSERGFSFESVSVSGDDEPKVSKSKKASDEVLSAIKKIGSIAPPAVAKILGDVSKVQKVMKDLVNAGLLSKEGRGASTLWTLIK
jgi:predicted ATP-dependent serine protease